MAVLKKGEYKGRIKDDDIYYHMFSPEEIAFNGEVIYVRIGDRDEEFGSNRNYTLLNVNEEEQKLIDNKK